MRLAQNMALKCADRTDHLPYRKYPCDLPTSFGLGPENPLPSPSCTSKAAAPHPESPQDELLQLELVAQAADGHEVTRTGRLFFDLGA
ncbi:hypothetical protein CDES_02235 [Corynebacterium deserti GIMN1.010]|uniref:Uncharacterized protein n=1 Tax=Corynebacterium deserti GIMN1.010 TaxID=931089 RepID=A0A0M4CGV8_9CORY|nr:hypothetical protein CDES_02235 [Corynebacterium deserti GIMN1.010]